MKARAAFSGLALASAIVAAPAAFGQTSAPAPNHIYVGAGYGQAHWRPGCPSVPACDDTEAALRVFGGYQINKTFAVEFAYNNLGKVTGTNVNIKGYAWESSLVAGWPVTGALSVFGRLGVFRGNAEGGGIFAGNKETNYGPTYGIGAQLDIHSNIALRTEWQAFPGVGGSTITDSDVNVISVSALWRFR